MIRLGVMPLRFAMIGISPPALRLTSGDFGSNSLVAGTFTVVIEAKTMNAFDAAILDFLNGFAGRSWRLDYLVVWLAADGFQKGGIVVLLLWWVWFRPGENLKTSREIIVCVCAVAPFAVALSRLISFLVPFRVRPIHVPDLHIRLAYTMSPKTLLNWSSFPSDHAVLFFTFVAALLLISWRIGLFALAHVLVVVCLPRIYLGIHYPTDLIVGAFLGAGIGYLACLPRMQAALGRPVLDWMNRHPALFYACLFFYTYQIADATGWAQDLIERVWHLIRHAAP
jgi:undecaprenyl-diphosphatase